MSKRLNQLLINLEEASAIYSDVYTQKKLIKFIIEAKKFAYIRASLVLDRARLSLILNLIEKKLSSHGDWEVGHVAHYEGRSPYCDGMPSKSILKLISYRNKLKSALKKAEYPSEFYYQVDSLEKALNKGLKKGIKMPKTLILLEILR